MGAFCGYIGVGVSVAYSLLQHFHLVEFTPIIDAVAGLLCPAAGVGGAVALHKSEPPK